MKTIIVDTATVQSLEIGDTVLIECKNGQQIVGPWKGTSVFQNEPILTVGLRGEYLREVKTVSVITCVTRVYDADKKLGRE